MNSKRGKTEIHQLLPGFSTGDAISNYALEIQGILRDWGYVSDIFCVYQHTSSKVREYSRDYHQHREHSTSDNIMIYHFSIGSEVTDYFKSIPDKKILIYHNITPARYFRSINDEKARVLYEGQRELFELSAVPDLALGVSEFNRKELVEAGFKNTGVLPLMLNLDNLSRRPAVKVLNRYRDNFVNFLFVGRLSPNKKVEDVIKIFFYYKKFINSQSRLLLVGSFVGMDKYLAYLRALTIELDLPDVVFPGHVTFGELSAYYHLADLFICMSEHEGFCIPLLESMYFHVPIVAYRAGAIPETLNGCGILVKEKRYEEIAEMADLLIKDKEFRKRVTERQDERLGNFAKSKIESKLRMYLNQVKEG